MKKIINTYKHNIRYIYVFTNHTPLRHQPHFAEKKSHPYLKVVTKINLAMHVK